MNNTYNFEIREIDAWYNPDDGWWYNETWKICDGKTSAENIKRVFYQKLKEHGIIFNRGKVFCYDDGNVLEIMDKKTKEPLFCMIIDY